MLKKLISIILCLCIMLIPISVNADEESENTNSGISWTPGESETTTDTNSNTKEETNTQEKKDKESTKKDTKKEEKKETKKEEKTEKKSEDSNKKETSDEYKKYTSNNDSTAAYRRLIAYYDPDTSTELRYPLSRQGSLTTHFGSIDSVHSTPHSGIDFAISTGTPIVACNSGVIERASWYGGYGNCVEIRHEDGSTTLYGHMSEINVQKGDKVIRGQQIGKVGSTGHSTGPHVHLEYCPPNSNDPIDPMTLLKKVTSEYNYTDVKFTFVNKEKVNSETSLENLNVEDIYFQLNEQLEPQFIKGKTVIDINKFYENGLLNSEELNITCSEKCNVEFKDHKIILDKEVKQSKIQIIIPSNKFTKMVIPVSIENLIDHDFENILLEYSPLFNIKIDLNAENITKENILVEVNDQILDDEYFDYSNNKLTLYYSCLNIKSINITILNNSRDVQPLKEENNISNIVNWIESDDISIIKFNSFIENCYYINSLMSNDISETPVVYNRYNNDTDKSNILLDNKTADGYISIPIKLGTTKVNFDSITDKYIEDTNINIKDKDYNTFIYGEKLNILDKSKIKEGYKDVNFNIVDYDKDEKYNYFIISYEVEGIGGYFGIKIKN